MKIKELRAGDRVPAGVAAVEATLITWSVPHPVHPRLALVVWRLSTGELAFDALDVEQQLPDGDTPVEQTEDERAGSLHRAIEWPGPAPADVPAEEERHYIGVWGSVGGRAHATLTGSFVQPDGSYVDPRSPIPLGRWRSPADADGPLLYPVSAEVARQWIADDDADLADDADEVEGGDDDG